MGERSGEGGGGREGGREGGKEMETGGVHARILAAA